MPEGSCPRAMVLISSRTVRAAALTLVYRAQQEATAAMTSRLLIVVTLSHIIKGISIQIISCNKMKDSCLSDMDGCGMAWNFFKEVCVMQGPSLRIVDSSDCNITIQYLTDRYPEFRSCVNTKTSLCHLLLDESCAVKDTSENWRHEKDSGPLEQLGPPSVRSCTDVKKLCIQNETCNRLLVPRLSACPEDPAQCNASRCQVAVQRFYEMLPFNMAEMLAFCDCSVVDDDCLHLKRSFHDRMCSGDIGPSSTCIDVLDRCTADAACRRRFNAFHSKCWSEGQEACNGSKDCRAAFIATRGTVLQIPCTCRGLERSQWSKCRHFQSLFHGKSCFAPSSLESNTYFKSAIEQEIKSSQISSIFNGTFFCVVTYILVIMLATMFITLVFYRTRICRESRRRIYSPPLDPNECLVMY